jgi:hypothetical protein
LSAWTLAFFAGLGAALILWAIHVTVDWLGNEEAPEDRDTMM